MANPISTTVQKVRTFTQSSDMDAVSGAVGALVGVVLVPYTPQLTFLGKWSSISNVIYGLALIALGAWVKHDGIGYFLVGMGIAYFVDGLVRVFIPSVTASATYAPETAVHNAYPVTANAYSGSIMYNG